MSGLMRSSFCGTGGCHTLVLDPHGDTYNVLASLTITRPPIRVLPSTTNGLRDITVWVQGGGISLGYEALLPFDGRQYATNPTIAPARKLRGSVAGETVIARGTPASNLASVQR